jgi:hypothetical protein
MASGVMLNGANASVNKIPLTIAKQSPSTPALKNLFNFIQAPRFLKSGLV